MKVSYHPAARAQQGLTNDVVRQAQGDFINHPVTQTAIGLMSFASGGVDAIMAIGRTAGNFIAKQTTMNAIESGQYNLSKSIWDV